MVLIVLSIAVVLGSSYLSMASTKVQSSQNYALSARVRYLAESGIEHGMYILETNPDRFSGISRTNPLGPFYADDSQDGYYISAEADSVVTGRYTLFAKGASLGLMQESQATVYRSSARMFDVKHGLTMGISSATLPTSLKVKGDMYVNGSVVNYGHVEGSVKATGNISDPYHFISGNLTPNAPNEDIPKIKMALDKMYDLGGANCQAEERKLKTLSANDPLTKGGAITLTNPGGVVILNPTNTSVTLPDNLDFTGTIIVKGDLILGGRNITLTAVKGFPSLIVHGKIIVKDTTGATINGVVDSTGGICAASVSMPNARTTINGGLVSDSGGYDYYLSGTPNTHVLNYDAARCKLYDFKNWNGGTYRVQMGNWIH